MFLLRHQRRSAMSSSAAREVIQDWADGEAGYTFERGRMEKAVRDVCLENPAKLHSNVAAPAKPTMKLNKDDVDFIVGASMREERIRQLIHIVAGQRADGVKSKGRGSTICKRRRFDESSGQRHDSAIKVIRQAHCILHRHHGSSAGAAGPTPWSISFILSTKRSLLSPSNQLSTPS
jgi:hypothetical protein